MLLQWTEVLGAARYVLQMAASGTPFANVLHAVQPRYSGHYPSPATLRYRVKACSTRGVCSAYSDTATIQVMGGDDVQR